MTNKAIVLVLFGLGVGLVMASGHTTENPHGTLTWNCLDCHTTESWTELRSDKPFEHAATGFRLDGSHRPVACRSCHTDLEFSHVGTACADCHDDQHSGRLGTNCASCHSPQDWEPRQDMLMRHAELGFPLTGVHAVADCEACHQSTGPGEYVGTPAECAVCHAEQAAAVTDPDHMNDAFNKDCQLCHRSAFGSWTQNLYIHPAAFPLTGAHASLDCSACHTNGFGGEPSDCYGCHQTDYESTDDPNHIENDFAVTCQDCHSTVAWSPSTFDHAATGFALTGAHLGADCSACHAGGYSGTPSNCYACHQLDYESAGDPDHAANSFATTCQDCHSTSAWSPATFDHNTVGFALLGAHATTSCVNCHASGYAGTPTACYACHQAEYDGTTDPDHAAASFPIDCQNCHTPVSWEAATWDHDNQYFPIYTGAHSGRWDNCIECHTTPSDYSSFDCTACHEHNQTDSDLDHSEVQGYQYLSSACYSCHPRGRN